MFLNPFINGTPVQQPPTTTAEQPPTTQTSYALSAYEQRVVDLTNKERAKNGLAALTNFTHIGVGHVAEGNGRRSLSGNKMSKAAGKVGSFHFGILIARCGKMLKSHYLTSGKFR